MTTVYGLSNVHGYSISVNHLFRSRDTVINARLHERCVSDDAVRHRVRISITMVMMMMMVIMNVIILKAPTFTLKLFSFSRARGVRMGYVMSFTYLLTSAWDTPCQPISLNFCFLSLFSLRTMSFWCAPCSVHFCGPRQCCFRW